jgi:hypothetical protein
MTIIPGQAVLKTLAEAADGLIDLSQDNSALRITTVVGANDGDRLCMWARTVAANTIDVGNLIIISGKGFADSLPEPMLPATPCEFVLPIVS